MNLYSLLRKRWFSISSVVASKPPALTRADELINTPFGLTMNTWPVAFSAPSSALDSAPRTLLSTTDDREGWLNLTDSLNAMPNFCQSMMALLVVWLICIAPSEVLMLTAPAATVGFCGSASAVHG